MATRRRPHEGFDHAEIPTIACFNLSTLDLGVDWHKLITAMQVYVDRHVAPVWGTPAKLITTRGFRKHCWAMVFLDEPDDSDDADPGDEGWHELTPDGFPLSKVFVQSTFDNKDLVSVSASHELVEMLVDPAMNLMSTGPDEKAMYAYESADPVEALSFDVKGIPMSDFVYPSYFESFRKRDSARFDHLNKIRKPFQLLPGGYQQIFKHGRWTDRFGSAAKAKLFAKEDRRGHRSESRKTGELRRTSRRALPRSMR